MSDPVTRILGRSLPVRTFAVQMGVIIGLFTTIVIVGIYLRTAHLAYEAVHEQATSYTDLIVAARDWNSGHGGTWVTKGPGVDTNPYLVRLGVEADTSTVSGQALTLRNPSAMTSEISRIVNARQGVTFRLTSLKPVNPAHAPDAWERASLEGFTSDKTPVSRIDERAGKRFYRAMRPLITEKSCLTCHAGQGYRVGDIRGAISVSVPLARVDAGLRRDAAWLMLVWLIVIIGTEVGLYLMVYRLAVRVDESEAQLQRIATTDALTGIANRRALAERLTSELARFERDGAVVGVAMIDIDHFKRVNDDFGHAAGDLVLAAVAARLTAVIREYDVVGRFGGEEFLVVAPQIDAAGLAALGERLRAEVGSTDIAANDVRLRVSVSVGTAMSHPGDTPESLVHRADEALYAAKAAGRDRVVAD